MSAAIAAATALGAWFVIDVDVLDPKQDRRVDWIGAILVTVGLVLLTFVLGEGESAPHQWKTPCEYFQGWILFPSNVRILIGFP